MKIPFPERFPLLYVALFGLLLVMLQQLDGTSLVFSIYSFLFIFIAAMAFNLAGGMTTPSGAYVFFYSMFGAIVGLVWKSVLGQPGDSNLLRPQLTLAVFLVGITTMWGSVWVSQKLRRKRAFLENIVSPSNLQTATVGSLTVGAFLYFLAHTTSRVSGSALSVLLQVNRFSELAIILGVTYQIRRSGGRSSVNVPVLVAGAVIFVLGGLWGFSKEAMFTPFVCWGVAAGAQGYRVSRRTMVFLVLAVLFLFRYMVPYSQYGRTQSGVSFAGNIALSGELLSDLGSVRRHFNEAVAAEATDTNQGYFGKSQGFMDRLHMIGPDDALIDATERDGPYGIFPIIANIENLVPHFLWPGKPQYLWGNVFAHQAGMDLPEEDYTTGVSFTPTGEAFHLERWAGLFLVAPPLWILLFTVFDSLCGDVRKSPWGLLATAVFAHQAAEGMLDAIFYSIEYGSITIIFAAFTAAYVMPLVGSLFVGPGARMEARVDAVRRLPRRVSTGGAVESA